jgi:hypothetical protein
MGDAELVEILIRATRAETSETEGVPGPFPGQILKRWKWKEVGGQAAQHKEQTHQALSLFPIDWSLGLGGHWKAKVRGWLHERRVTEGGERSGELRAGIRLRHIVVGVSEWSPEWGSIEMLVDEYLGLASEYRTRYPSRWDI